MITSCQIQYLVLSLSEFLRIFLFLDFSCFNNLLTWSLLRIIFNVSLLFFWKRILFFRKNLLSLLMQFFWVTLAASVVFFESFVCYFCVCCIWSIYFYDQRINLFLDTDLSKKEPAYNLVIWFVLLKSCNMILMVDAIDVYETWIVISKSKEF